MTLATQIVDQRVSGIVERHGQTLRDEFGVGGDDGRMRSLAFLFVAAKTLLSLTDDETVEGIVDGGQDFGVDCLYFDLPADGEIAVTLIQGKYKQDLSGDAAFPENAIAQLVAAVRTLFDPRQSVSLNPRLERRLEEVRSFVRDGSIPRMTVIAANNGARWPKDADDRIHRAARDFGNQVEWNHVGSEELLSLMTTTKPVDAELQLSGQAIVEPFDFRRVLVGRMSVAELARLVETHGDRVLERNIRRYLGLRGNRVNEAVAETLRRDEERANFYFYNNGITMTCAQFAHNALQRENWRVRLKDLQIVNGGQTAHTARRVANEAGQKVEAAEVLVRIYEIQANDTQLVDSITFATNSQNPVDLRDLKANDPSQTRLSEAIKALGYGYRTKRQDHPVAADELTSAVVAEAVLAVWRKRPHQARFRRRQHFGALYEEIFRPDLNGAQAIIASLILRRVENRRKRPPPNAPDFLAYGSRFVAMLLGRYLLTDLGIELRQLDHRNFASARDLLDANAYNYVVRGEERVGEALSTLFNGRERTLQRLSATFRRADLVDMLVAE